MSKANELSVDELLEIATKDGRTITNLMDDKTNVKEFIRDLGIKEGTCLVPNYKVYHDYQKLWRPQGKKLSKIGFLRKFSVVFSSTRTKTTRYYLLSPCIFDTDEGSINEAKTFDKRYRNKADKKAKQKIESKISSTRETI